jgi:signal transduction histidine kinase
LGIPAEELPRVTNRFYRGKNIATDTKGSGLGLYLSKYFVELHKGLLELESKMGVGTKVTVRLPLTP